MKLLYKPLGLIGALIAGLLSRQLFALCWRLIDRQPPPSPGAADAPLGKIVAAAALEGATQRATRAAVDRATALTFQHLFGVWPNRRDEDGREAA